jgi:hypothetical protein
MVRDARVITSVVNRAFADHLQTKEDGCVHTGIDYDQLRWRWGALRPGNGWWFENRIASVQRASGQRNAGHLVDVKTVFARLGVFD